VLYRWRALAQGGSAVALKRDAQRKPRKDDAETRPQAEIERMRAGDCGDHGGEPGAEKKI